jgi:hypothetical protein
MSRRNKLRMRDLEKTQAAPMEAVEVPTLVDATKDLMIDQINTQREEIQALKIEINQLERKLEEAKPKTWWEWLFPANRHKSESEERLELFLLTQ